MPDFRVADTAPEHPKLRAAGLPAAGLWALAGAYSMRELTDGWVPEYWVMTWSGGKRQAATLIKVGLWIREERNGLPGYRYHDWEGYQRLASKIEHDRAEARKRAAKHRSGNGKSNGARNGAPPPESSAQRTRESHDSLPLSPEGGELGRLGASPERADEAGASQDRPIPDGWTPHEGHIRTAKRRGVSVEHQATQFVAHAQAHGRTAVDWDAAFTVWLGSARPDRGSTPNGNRTDANIAELIAAGYPQQQRAIGDGR